MKRWWSELQPEAGKLELPLHGERRRLRAPEPQRGRRQAPKMAWAQRTATSYREVLRVAGSAA